MWSPSSAGPLLLETAYIGRFMVGSISSTVAQRELNRNQPPRTCGIYVWRLTPHTTFPEGFRAPRGAVGAAGCLNLRNTTDRGRLRPPVRLPHPLWRVQEMMLRLWCCPVWSLIPGVLPTADSIPPRCGGRALTPASPELARRSGWIHRKTRRGSAGGLVSACDETNDVLGRAARGLARIHVLSGLA